LRTKIKIFLLSFFILHSTFLIPCQCPFTSLSLSECDKYELIFRGRVFSVEACEREKGKALFEILELYKGNTTSKLEIVFDCNVPCAQTFNAGEEWIIYTRYRQVNNAKMDWCSRSRKYFKNEKLDFYTVTYGNNYDEELSFLRSKLGTHKLAKDNEPKLMEERNQLPDNSQKIIFLLVSLAVIVLFYYLFNKFFK
jgi:hypothetical protein